MPDEPRITMTPAAPPGFPFGTAVATLVGLFLFLGLVLVAYYSPNYLGGGPGETKADPVAKLEEVRARNRAVLDGADSSAKLPVDRATVELLGHAAKTKDDANKYGRLPFPVPPPPAPDADKK